MVDDHADNLAGNCLETAAGDVTDARKAGARFAPFAELPIDDAVPASLELTRGVAAAFWRPVAVTIVAHLADVLDGVAPCISVLSSRYCARMPPS